jgi:hypothetical protein
MDLPHGHHRLRQTSSGQQVQAFGTLTHSCIQVSLLALLPTIGSGLLAVVDTGASFTWRAGAIALWNASMDGTVLTYLLATHRKTGLCKFDPNIEDLLIFMKYYAL